MLPSFGPRNFVQDGSLSLTLSKGWREVKSPSTVIASKAPFIGKSYQKRHGFCPDKNSPRPPVWGRKLGSRCHCIWKGVLSSPIATLGQDKTILCQTLYNVQIFKCHLIIILFLSHAKMVSFHSNDIISCFSFLVYFWGRERHLEENWGSDLDGV